MELRTINKRARLVEVKLKSQILTMRNKRKGMTVKAIPAFPAALNHSKCLDCALIYICERGEFCNRARGIFGSGSFLFVKI